MVTVMLVVSLNPGTSCAKDRTDSRRATGGGEQGPKEERERERVREFSSLMVVCILLIIAVHMRCGIPGGPEAAPIISRASSRRRRARSRSYSIVLRFCSDCHSFSAHYVVVAGAIWSNTTVRILQAICTLCR